MLKEHYETFNILLHYIHMLAADEITGTREQAAKFKWLND